MRKNSTRTRGKKPASTTTRASRTAYRSCRQRDDPARDDMDEEQRRREETRSFIFLTIVMAPVLAGLFVSGYGFIV